MLRHFDAAVIGGGPAGLSAAIALAQRGTRVILFDDARCAATHVETLQSRARSIITDLGVPQLASEAIAGIIVPAIASGWASEAIQEWPSILDPAGAPWHIRRLALRGVLARFALTLGVLRVSSRARAIPVHRGWELHSKSTSGRVSASFLVVATGRAPIPIPGGIDRWCVDRLIAVLAEAARPGLLADGQLSIRAAPDGWWYSCPRPEGGLQIGFFTDSDVLRRLRLARDTDRLSAFAVRDGLCCDPLDLENVRLVPAQTYCRKAVVGDRVVVAGDAAMAGDPLGGDGLTRALLSGLEAADLVCSVERRRRDLFAEYSDVVRERFGEFLYRRYMTYSEVKRWPKRAFWSRRLF